jgi:hypothetical protein
LLEFYVGTETRGWCFSGRIFDGCISIEMSMLTGVVCKIVALVLDVFGVKGVGGLTSIIVEVLMGVGYWCDIAPVGWFIPCCVE